MDMQGFCKARIFVSHHVVWIWSNNEIYPMLEISDFQRTNSEFVKSEQKYPVKVTLAYAH
jgi:hypothetical protein